MRIQGPDFDQFFLSRTILNTIRPDEQPDLRSPSEDNRPGTPDARRRLTGVNAASPSFPLDIDKKRPKAIGEHHGRKDRRQQRRQMPVHGRRPRTDQPRLVAEHARPPGSPSQFRTFRSDGRVLRLRQGVQDARSRRRLQGLEGADDGLAGLVAGRLRPLWRPHGPHGLAQCRHLPHHRRPRRCRWRPAALRAAELVARQRAARSRAPAVVADQAEIRPQDFLGRSARARRQRRAGIDGLQDLRLRRRPRRRMGAAGAVLGAGRHLARR